jgi:hypothetical protein
MLVDKIGEPEGEDIGDYAIKKLGFKSNFLRNNRIIWEKSDFLGKNRIIWEKSDYLGKKSDYIIGKKSDY